VAEQLYHKFPPERLYEQIASKVEELVSSGMLHPGDKLPSERELAGKLGVGRGVVREAVKLLVERGLVNVLPGRGTFVTELGTDLLSDQLGRFFRVGCHSYRDLSEVRKILEVEIAHLAAQRATAEDLKEMRRAIKVMEGCIAPSDKYVEADLAFHLALARATQNKLFFLLIGVMVDLLWESKQVIFQVSEAPEEGQVWHRLIYQAVEKGDVPAAREAMRKYMQQITECKVVSELA